MFCFDEENSTYCMFPKNNIGQAVYSKVYKGVILNIKVRKKNSLIPKLAQGTS